VEFRYNTCVRNQPTKGAEAMYGITLHLHQPIIVMIHRSLFLLLLVSLLLYPFCLTQEQEVWHEDLVPWWTGGRVRHR